jgi:L-ascorbate metabolism protein UlaG (beta-lactamase superfamily)
MTITKIGHCCLFIEINGVRILTDPGNFTVSRHVLKKIDLVIISHEHADHVHVESIKELAKLNRDLDVVCNSSTARLFPSAGIVPTIVDGTKRINLKGLTIEAFDAPHAEIYEEYGQVQNTGYFISGRLFYPGDAYSVPGRPVEALALPVSGPWCKIGDAIRYAQQVMPKVAFPVHDGLIITKRLPIIHKTAQTVLSEAGIDFRPMKPGDVIELD